jgi:hypothetical protein
MLFRTVKAISMNKVWLLAAISVFMLPSAGASAAERPVGAFFGEFHAQRAPKGAKFLYNQNSNPTGLGIVSQNFTSGTYSNDNAEGADDFVVPDNTRWQITEVDVSGVYFNGSGPARSEDVIFYKDDSGEPGSVVKRGRFDNLQGKDQDGNFAIKLSRKGIGLDPGTYWVSVVANCSFEHCGEWGWEVNSVIHGNQAMWENPGDWASCPTWGTLEDCFGYSGDFMFDLRGSKQPL